ncbi:MAG: hypothetical protein KBA61_03450 [Spirochaetes bacterium]|nr:hypothetical protein [Spirochaetota bacterium]
MSAELDKIRFEISGQELYSAVTAANCDNLQISRIFSAIMKNHGEALGYERELDAALEQRFGLKPDNKS